MSGLATDMRKGFDGLFGLVRDALGEDPLSGHLFLFDNRDRTRLKVLVFDGSGLRSLHERTSKTNLQNIAVEFRSFHSPWSPADPYSGTNGAAVTTGADVELALVIGNVMTKPRPVCQVSDKHEKIEDVRR